MLIIPELQVNRALHFDPGLQVHLWNLLFQVVLVLPVPPIGPSKRRSQRTITWRVSLAWKCSGPPLRLEDHQSLGSLGFQERPARCGGQGFKQWGKNGKLRPFWVKVVLQLLQQALEVQQTQRHHEVHASLHLPLYQEHPEYRGLPCNNTPVASQTKLLLGLLVVKLKFEFDFSYSFPFKSRFSLNSCHSGITHLAFWPVQSCHSLGPWGTSGSQQPWWTSQTWDSLWQRKEEGGVRWNQQTDSYKFHSPAETLTVCPRAPGAPSEPSAPCGVTNIQDSYMDKPWVPPENSPTRWSHLLPCWARGSHMTCVPSRSLPSCTSSQASWSLLSLDNQKQLVSLILFLTKSH